MIKAAQISLTHSLASVPTLPARVVIILSSALLALSLHAQDEFVPPEGSTGVWGSVYVLGGSSTAETMGLFLADMRTLAPGSELLLMDLGSHTQRVGFGVDRSAFSAFSALAGFHPFRTEGARGPELRLGVQYGGGRVGNLAYDREEYFPYDTLLSPNSGVQYIVDSITYSELTMEHHAERVGVDASLIFRTGGRSRWSVYGGPALGLGAVFNAYTTIRHDSGSSIDYPGGGGSSVSEQRTESYRNAGAMWFSAAVHFGFGFRMARYGDFLRRIDLFYEFRPQMLVTVGDDLGGTTRFGNQLHFGARVRLDR